MSGLEVLGAAASIFGVISAVKTCVDLLDIISTARSAQRDLEDLLVFLQWQRIRFFCWVLETGFANAIDAGTRNGLEQTPSISSHQMLAMLPREFRMPFFLAHIERIITNMSSRLQATEQIIQRYCATEKIRPSSARGRSWAERMAYFLDRRSVAEPANSLSPPLLRSHSPRTPSPTTTAEARKLALWDKVRWVSGDVKELKHLLDTLQQYNTQLADMLPPSRSRSFRRRFERELTTSPGMASQLVTLDTGSNGPIEDPEELRQARQYRVLISLLERHDGSRVEISDTQNGIEGGIGPKTSSPSRFSSPLPLHLRLADMTFANFPTSACTDREFVSYNQIPAIVEWRYYPNGISAQERSYIDARVHGLSMQLCQLSAVSDGGLLSCLGYVHDETNSRYGTLFAYPRGCDASFRPMSLQERLRRDHERHVRCELKERFDLAHSLILVIYRLLSVNWLHRNLSSDSLLLFDASRSQTADGGSGGSWLFVCGFARSRRDAQLELSEKAPTEPSRADRSDDHRLYWHPDRVVVFEAAANNRGGSAGTPPCNLLPSSYRREFDVYSLGILLLEIGLWCPIRRISRDSRSQTPAAFASELRTRYVPELEGRMGKVYARIVAYCLAEGSVKNVSATSNDEYLAQTKRFLETFEQNVVAKIEGPYLGVE
ncbi:hypothetical protein C8A05DRAFT_19733 [Staphylotrichum tortipilum]|uniref:Prion-inhibition and propagation HeLo domain-containing protein n=1 Tax=Staphylotrichum tortipilum TaxID=2831512 RepID=A0AAN6RNE4_9PEZI|nr:hypothetical protein C8A05DRAFT_19733 [Staphylotrichum longicolle]